MKIKDLVNKLEEAKQSGYAISYDGGKVQYTKSDTADKITHTKKKVIQKIDKFAEDVSALSDDMEKRLKKGDVRGLVKQIRHCAVNKTPKPHIRSV